MKHTNQKPRTKRKKRKGEFTCYCNAYKFPHRFGSGKCDGYWIAYETWHYNFGQGICSGCMSCDKDDQMTWCQVVNGIEKPDQCPEVQEFVRMNEIKLRAK